MRYRPSETDRRLLRALYIASVSGYGPLPAHELAFAVRSGERHVRKRLPLLRLAGLVHGGRGGWEIGDAGIVLTKWLAMSGE